MRHHLHQPLQGALQLPAAAAWTSSNPLWQVMSQASSRGCSLCLCIKHALPYCRHRFSSGHVLNCASNLHGQLPVSCTLGLGLPGCMCGCLRDGSLMLPRCIPANGTCNMLRWRCCRALELPHRPLHGGGEPPSRCSLNWDTPCSCAA